MKIQTAKTALVILLAFSVGAIFAMPRPAYAVVPVAEPCIPFLSFQCLKKTILDPAKTIIAKTFIQALRAATINWILTGDFEIKKPFFVTSFIADPQRIADVAARLFLSELTGINFCNFHPNIKSVGAININLNFNALLTCSFSGNYDNYLNGAGPDDDWADFFAIRRPENLASLNLLATAGEKEKQVVRATAANIREAAAGGGWLGQRDPKTGKIKTPGRLIAESFNNANLAEQIGKEVTDEFYEAVTDIIDTALGAIIQKGLLQ